MQRSSGVHTVHAAASSAFTKRPPSPFNQIHGSAAAASSNPIPAPSPLTRLHQKLTLEVLKLNTLSQQIESKKKNEATSYQLNQYKNKLENQCRILQLEISSITFNITSKQKLISESVDTSSGSQSETHTDLLKSLEMLLESKRLKLLKFKSNLAKIEEIEGKLKNLEKIGNQESPLQIPEMNEEERGSINRNLRAISTLPAEDAGIIIGFEYLSTPKAQSPLSFKVSRVKSEPRARSPLSNAPPPQRQLNLILPAIKRKSPSFPPPTRLKDKKSKMPVSKPSLSLKKDKPKDLRSPPVKSSQTHKKKIVKVGRFTLVE